jgi:hypothetical protein
MTRSRGVSRLLAGIWVLGFGICLAAPLAAHHNANAKYDPNKPITLKGKVTKVEWMNPHIYFYMDAADQSGKVFNWAVEGATPNQLYRRGWKRDSLKVGDLVTVEAVMARQAGLHHVNGRSVVLPDGRKVFSGSAEDALSPAAKPATK